MDGVKRFALPSFDITATFEGLEEFLDEPTSAIIVNDAQDIVSRVDVFGRIEQPFNRLFAVRSLVFTHVNDLEFDGLRKRSVEVFGADKSHVFGCDFEVRNTRLSLWKA